MGRLGLSVNRERWETSDAMLPSTTASIIRADVFESAPTYATPAIVQTASGNGGGYSNTNVQTFSSPATAGNFIAVAITAGAANTIASISDNLGNTYSLVTSYTVTSDRTVWFYYAKNIVGGSLTLTIVYAAGTFPDSTAIMREYSGIDKVSPLDVFATSSNQSNFIQSHTSSATATTTQSHELVLSVGGSSGSTNPSFAVGSGYSNLRSQSGFDAFTYGMMQDKNVTSIGTQTATYTTTEFVKGIVIVAAFKAASIAPPATTGRVKLFVSGSWVAKPKKHFNGTAWTTKPQKYFNGTTWVVTNY